MGFSTIDRHRSHNAPDVTVVEKREKQVKIIDITIPGVSRVEEKRTGKNKIQRFANGN